MGSRPLSYGDAARLLGVPDNPLIKVLNVVSGVAATAISVGTLADRDIFALRAEAIKWASTAVTGLQERMNGVSRFDRTQRLVAAHSIVVVTSFFKALDTVLADHTQLSLKAARLVAAEQVAVVTPTAAVGRHGDLIQALIDSPPPLPTPHRPFEWTIDELRLFFRQASAAALAFLGGLSAFEAHIDELGETLVFAEMQLVDTAIGNYIEDYRALMVQAPEFSVWAYMVDAQSTRALFHDSFESLSQRIADLQATGAAAAEAAVIGLDRRHQAVLDRPVLSSTQAPTHVILPSLGEAYVSPHGLVATAGPRDLPATDCWWAQATRVDDVQDFLLAHLTSPQAARSPLVVLGHPGSGKSAMTKFLAARLPAASFLVVRVSLRNVAADSSIQSQIEQSLLQMLGEHVSWPDLARRAGDALPVVVLDGFDELLQATGVNRADYFQEIQQFQQREQELGRPVAVLVTSRTVVADRARFPADSVVLRLEPFDETQVRHWLGVWNLRNAAGLEARGLRSLPPEIALAHADLARQPLLLLLLCLYDAGDNSLQAAGPEMRAVDLYARLFADFVEREVDKRNRGWDDDRRRGEIATEWRRLCAVAAAILNRGGDVILEQDLTDDLPHLLTAADLRLASATSADRALTAGQLMVGRFFFIHESHATRDTGVPERSFEFLHATFGDFLAARHIVAELLDLAEERVHQQRRRGSIDPGPLHATTSSVTITRRAPLWDFCRGLLAQLDERQRHTCRELALELLPDAGYAHPTWTRGNYNPRGIPLAAQHAAFSANLVCFVVLLSDEPVDAVELVGEPVVENWRRQALLWRSQLHAADSKTIWQFLRVAWRLDADPARLEVRPEDGTSIGVYESIPWPPDTRPTSRRSRDLDQRAAIMAPDITVDSDSRIGKSLRRSAFVQTAHEVRECLYDLIPYWREVGVPSLHQIDGEPFLVSEMALFLHLLLSSADAQPSELRAKQYTWVFGLTKHPRQRDLLVSRLAEDAPRLSRASLIDIFARLWASDVRRNHEVIRALLKARADDHGSAAAMFRSINWASASGEKHQVQEMVDSLQRDLGFSFQILIGDGSQVMAINPGPEGEVRGTSDGV